MYPKDTEEGRVLQGHWVYQDRKESKVTSLCVEVLETRERKVGLNYQAPKTFYKDLNQSHILIHVCVCEQGHKGQPGIPGFSGRGLPGQPGLPGRPGIPGPKVRQTQKNVLCVSVFPSYNGKI